MEPKDYITIGISACAFLVSLVSFIVSRRSKKQEDERKEHEDERTLRSLMNDTINNIRTARIEQAKYAAGHGQKDQLVIGQFNYQINSLARLAVYITERIPGLVTDIEFATLADAFNWTGDRQKARQYWENAIATSKDQYYEIVNRRDYANFLFLSGNVGAGREQYKKALELSPITDDTSKYMTGHTYRMWGWNERAAGNELTAKEYYDKAAEAYTTISVEGMRAFAMADLEQARLTTSAAIPSPKPGEVPPGPAIADPTQMLKPVSPGTP
jgi:tetratricopeptide (TPR) repeat protein